MKTIILRRVALIETKPLKIASVDRPAIKKGNDRLIEIEARAVLVP